MVRIEGGKILERVGVQDEYQKTKCIDLSCIAVRIGCQLWSQSIVRRGGGDRNHDTRGNIHAIAHVYTNLNTLPNSFSDTCSGHR